MATRSAGVVAGAFSSTAYITVVIAFTLSSTVALSVWLMPLTSAATAFIASVLGASSVDAGAFHTGTGLDHIALTRWASLSSTLLENSLKLGDPV